jgi:hypothetical protein
MDDEIAKINKLIGSHGAVELVPSDSPPTQNMNFQNNPNAMMEFNKQMQQAQQAMNNVNSSGGNPSERGAEIISQLSMGNLQTIKKDDAPMAEPLSGEPLQEFKNEIPPNNSPNVIKETASKPVSAPLQPQIPQKPIRASFAGGAMGGLSGDVCSQCGLMHPPVSGKCPNIAGKDAEGKEINSSKFLTDMKNILESKIAEKNIKDHNKFFGMITVEVMKFIETYEEKSE